MTHLDSLNSAQRKAAEHSDGPLLVLAGAGAGKTRVITARILNLVKNGIAPERILAITFTNKAASEMRERVLDLLRKDPEGSRALAGERSGPHVSTFHSLGVTVIRDNAHRLNLPRHFTIYDRNDSKRAVKEALKKIDVDPKQFEPGKMLSIISRAKGDGLTREQFEVEAEGHFIKEIAARAWREYETALNNERALDFDDLLLKTLLLLREHSDVREYYQRYWSHIHVDEYQDTNGVQYEISKILAEKHSNICVVGDMDQTIYTWRGANLRNLLNFERDFSNVSVILLEENYRSTATIIAASNAIIKKNTVRKEKNLYTHNDEGERITLYSAFDETDEATFIAQKAAEYISAGTPAGEIAVLYRANFQSRVLEEAFLDAGVPYQILGTRFFERKEVKDILSFLRFALNETNADLARIVNVPPRGIGKATLLKLVSNRRDELTPALARRVDAFYNMIESLRQTIFTRRPSEAVKSAITESGLEALFLKGSDEDRERLENLRELVTLTKKYDHLPLGDGVTKLIEEATLASDQDALEKHEEAVKLMTVHASKGLEFEVVFVSGLEEGLFPHTRLDEDSLSKEALEEERRLFYVALTRAKRKVFLSHTAARTIFGSRQMNAPSEFIGELGEEFIDTEEPEEPSDDGLLGDWTGKTIYLD